MSKLISPELASADDSALIIFTGPSKRGWHRLQQAAECLQKYAWTYGTVEGDNSGALGHDNDEVKAPALLKGELIHLALAQHYARMRQRQNGQDPDRFVTPEEAVTIVAKIRGSTIFVGEVLKTYEKYVERYEDDEVMIKILGVEELIEANIRGRYLLTGRMDLVYEDAGGRVWVCDHKTTSRLGSDGKHKQFYSASGQLIGYQHLGRIRYGDRLAGMKLNIIEYGGRKFERVTLARAPWFEDQFEQTVVDIEESIERMQQSGRKIDAWPKAMNEMTCFGRYGACPFLENCRWGKESATGGDWSWDEKS